MNHLKNIGFKVSKCFVVLFVTGIAMLSIKSPLYAQVDFFQACEKAPESEYCKNVSSETSKDRVLGPDSILVKIIKIIVMLTIAISVIMVVIGALKYTLSGGDSNGLQSAKNTILYALVGIVIGIFAQVIVSFVVGNIK